MPGEVTTSQMGYEYVEAVSGFVHRVTGSMGVKHVVDNGRGYVVDTEIYEHGISLKAGTTISITHDGVILVNGYPPHKGPNKLPFEAEMRCGDQVLKCYGETAREAMRDLMESIDYFLDVG